jgi:hypothetical protein
MITATVPKYYLSPAPTGFHWISEDRRTATMERRAVERGIERRAHREGIVVLTDLDHEAAA